MKELFERIKSCALRDKAKTQADFYMYAVEEMGEIATCIAVGEGNKDRVLVEPTESECCDAIISILGLIARNPNWDYNKVVATISAKLPKWESRVNKGITNDKSSES